MKNTEKIIDWDKNFFVYPIPVMTFYNHRDDADKLTDELKNLKEGTWSLDKASTAQVGDYFLIKVGDDRTKADKKYIASPIQIKTYKNAVLSLAQIKSINDSEVSFNIVNNFYNFPIVDKSLLDLTSMR